MIDHYLNVGGQGSSFVYKTKNSILCILFELSRLMTIKSRWSMGNAKVNQFGKLDIKTRFR